MQHSNKFSSDARSCGLYQVAKDYGYAYRQDLVAVGQDVSVDTLEEAIYSWLMSVPEWAATPDECAEQAAKAAARVFDTFRESSYP